MSPAKDLLEFRIPYDFNEYIFYSYMPDSEVKETDLGFFLKNKTIETYSYITPTLKGSEEFSSFLAFSFSFFNDGSEYFVLKLPYDKNYMRNSKILREKKFIKAFNDVNVMVWEEAFDSLQPNEALRIDKLSLTDCKRWVEVFFDAFNYPRNLRKYIQQMVQNQINQGVDFFVGVVSDEDVSCFCTHKTDSILGLFGVGTKHKFQRRGYAAAMLSNYILDQKSQNNELAFCLQTNINSGAEQLYTKLGFYSSYIQKRFDWNPSTLNQW